MNIKNNLGQVVVVHTFDSQHLGGRVLKSSEMGASLV